MLTDNSLILPTLHISGVKLFFQDINWSALGFDLDVMTGLPVDLELKPDQNQLTFLVKSVSVKNGSQTFYRYRLEGLEDEFSPISSGPMITYHDLRPGQ